MRNAFCTVMTQPLTGKRLDSLRSETSAAQSIFSQVIRDTKDPSRGVDRLTWVKLWMPRHALGVPRDVPPSRSPLPEVPHGRRLRANNTCHQGPSRGTLACASGSGRPHDMAGGDGGQSRRLPQRSAHAAVVPRQVRQLHRPANLFAIQKPQRVPGLAPPPVDVPQLGLQAVGPLKQAPTPRAPLKKAIAGNFLDCGCVECKNTDQSPRA